MDGRLILLCLSCAVIGQTQGWGYEEPARVVVPTKVFAPAPVITQAIAPTPISAHRHRYSGSLSLAKAKTVINTDDAIINSGYGYASYPVSGYSSYPVFGGHHGYAGAVDGHNGYADVIDGHRGYADVVDGHHGYADVVDGHHGYADVIDGHHGYASVVDGHRGYVRPTVVSAAPERYFHVERHTSPLLAPPLTSYGALVRYGHHNDLHRDNDYHHYQADLAEQDHFQRFRAEQDDKLHHFQDYIRHEAQEAANRQQLREYERFHKLDNYVHNLERKVPYYHPRGLGRYVEIEREW